MSTRHPSLTDRLGYGVIVRDYGPQLASTLRAHGVMAGDVDEVMQEAFVAAWRAFDQYDPNRPFKTWLFHIGLNKARDLRRRRRVRQFFFSAVGLKTDEALRLASPDPDPEREATGRHVLRQVADAIDTLPADLRHVLVLTTLHEMTYREVGLA